MFLNSENSVNVSESVLGIGPYAYQNPVNTRRWLQALIVFSLPACVCFNYGGKASPQNQFQSLDAGYLVARNHVHIQ
ncbi:hypothetical protein STEG23_030210 [Scotinomys teguina]